MKFTRYTLALTAIMIMGTGTAHAVEDAEFWGGVREKWGQYATPETVGVLKADVTCDGVEDIIGYRTNLDNPDGAFFDILLATDDTDWENAYIETHSLGFDGDMNQYGMCGTPGETPPPEVFVEAWDEAEVTETFGVSLCNKPIGISDGMCDINYFFWDPDVPDDVPDALVHFRN